MYVYVCMNNSFDANDVVKSCIGKEQRGREWNRASYVLSSSGCNVDPYTSRILLIVS